MTAPVGPITGDAARAAARTELSRPEYHRDDPSIIDRALHWIGDRLDSVVSGTPSGSATLILVVLLAAVIVFAVVRAGRPRRLARQRAAGIDPLAADASVDHRARAAAYERDGRLAEAMREWLRAAVGTVEARGVLDPRPGRTGVALAREAGPVFPELASDLAHVVDAFDEIWFGRRPAEPVDAQNAHRVADAVRTARIARPVSLVSPGSSR